MKESNVKENKQVEEAIKIIQEQKEDAEHGIKYLECTPEDYDEDIYNSYIETKKKAETVLNYIKELEETLKCTQNSWYNDTKKIQELQKERDGIYADYQDLGKQYYDSIPKQVIRDKIEKLEKEYKEIEQRSDFIIADTIQPKIQVLNELLEEE